jgi:hypothetical protein
VVRNTFRHFLTNTRKQLLQTFRVVFSHLLTVDRDFWNFNHNPNSGKVWIHFPQLEFDIMIILEIEKLNQNYKHNHVL